MKTSVGSRTFLILKSDTKANRMIAAEFSTRQGWKYHGPLEGSSRCCFCATQVYAIRREIGGVAETWTQALDGSMFDHMEAVHGPQVEPVKPVVHLCSPPARVTTDSRWTCGCGSQWLYCRLPHGRFFDWARVGGQR